MSLLFVLLASALPAASASEVLGDAKPVSKYQEMFREAEAPNPLLLSSFKDWWFQCELASFQPGIADRTLLLLDHEFVKGKIVKGEDFGLDHIDDKELQLSSDIVYRSRYHAERKLQLKRGEGGAYVFSRKSDGYPLMLGSYLVAAESRFTKENVFILEESVQKGNGPLPEDAVRPASAFAASLDPKAHVSAYTVCRPIEIQKMPQKTAKDAPMGAFKLHVPSAETSPSEPVQGAVQGAVPEPAH